MKNKFILKNNKISCFMAKSHPIGSNHEIHYNVTNIHPNGNVLSHYYLTVEEKYNNECATSFSHITTAEELRKLGLMFLNTAELIEEKFTSSYPAYMCQHANECPNICECVIECYCKVEGNC